MIPLIILIDNMVKPDGVLSQIIQRKGFELVVIQLTLKEMKECWISTTLICLAAPSSPVLSIE